MKRVLVAPLDWGLGHATRCVPVIRELQRQGCEVLIAGSGDSLELLRMEFPGIPTFVLPAYRPRYPRSGGMVWSMALQLPRFMSVIAAEHRAISHIISSENVGIVISDNRYGCWSENILSVFITHQSNILMPRRFGWLQSVVRRMSDRMINRFNVCWIPDLPGDRSLAGDLIAFDRSAVRTRKEYIGWLSRFRPEKHAARKYDVVAVLSGPEPARTRMEEILRHQLQGSSLNYLIVRGLPSANDPPRDHHTVNFLTSEALQRALQGAALVIARSGFSTVMDLHAIGGRAIFIPTPGQTEQEYLALRLKEKSIAFFMRQEEFNLERALSASKNFSGFEVPGDNAKLQEAVERLLV